jgi:hypothetical protein
MTGSNRSILNTWGGGDTLLEPLEPTEVIYEVGTFTVIKEILHFDWHTQVYTLQVHSNKHRLPKCKL